MLDESFTNTNEFLDILAKTEEPSRQCLEKLYETLKKNSDNLLKITGVQEITRNSPDGTQDYWMESCNYKIEFRRIDGYLLVTRLIQLTGFEPTL